MAAVAPGREFWIVASGCDKEKSEEQSKQEKQATLDNLTKQLGKNCLGPWRFDVPDGEESLRYGTFDNLNKLADDLPKYDSQVDSIIHRLERQVIELSSTPVQLKVTSQRQEKPLTEYLSNWRWDEHKFPKTRPMTDTCTWMMGQVNRLDDECRNKTNQYNESKTQKTNIDKKESALLTGVDVIDLLTPEVVKMGSGPEDDFIYTEWLTTVTVILAKGAEKEFLKTYEKFADDVVPQSARRFGKLERQLEDKDGNTIWRVVMFKVSAEPFKKACRQRNYLTRDFEYSEDAYNKRIGERKQLEAKLASEKESLMLLYKAAWSDIMSMWMHIKAMRVFAESALWSGLPPKFAAFVVSPVPGKGDAVRKALADKLVGKAGGGTVPGSKADLDDVDEDYPYVSLSFVPFTVST
jgi:V-type H+-transporting ATPase subunit C